MKQEQTYTYVCRFRPPMPGSVPRSGLISVEDWGNRRAEHGVLGWGTATYERQLTNEEIWDYELAPVRE